MSTHKYSSVNPLVNPVITNDIIVAESGEKYIVKQTINGEYWLQHILSGYNLTHPVSGQIGICSQIYELEFI